MKKLSIYVFLGLLWCNISFAVEIPKGYCESPGGWIPCPKELKVDKEKKNKLEIAAKNKKNEFDDEITKLKGLKDVVNSKYERFKINFNTSLNSVEDTILFTKNTDILEIREKLIELINLKKKYFDGNRFKKLKVKIRSVKVDIVKLNKSKDYKSLIKLIKEINQAEEKKNHQLIKNQTVEKINKRQLIEAIGLDDEISKIKAAITTFDLIIARDINPLREKVDNLDAQGENKISFWKIPSRIVKLLRSLVH